MPIATMTAAAPAAAMSANIGAVEPEPSAAPVIAERIAPVPIWAEPESPDAAPAISELAGKPRRLLAGVRYRVPFDLLLPELQLQVIRALFPDDVARADGWLRGTGYHESVAGPLDRHALDAVADHFPRPLGAPREHRIGRGDMEQDFHASQRRIELRCVAHIELHELDIPQRAQRPGFRFVRERSHRGAHFEAAPRPQPFHAAARPGLGQRGQQLNFRFET